MKSNNSSTKAISRNAPVFSILKKNQDKCFGKEKKRQKIKPKRNKKYRKSDELTSLNN